MTDATPALFAAAAGVGFGHAILPDHWVPLAVLGRARRYPMAKIARLSGLAGVAHVLLSIVLGAVLIAVGLQFRHAVAGAQDAIIGCLLIATGIGFAALQATGHGHDHDHDPRPRPRPRRTSRITTTPPGTITTATARARTRALSVASAASRRSWCPSAPRPRRI